MNLDKSITEATKHAILNVSAFRPQRRYSFLHYLSLLAYAFLRKSDLRYPAVPAVRHFPLRIRVTSTMEPLPLHSRTDESNMLDSCSTSNPVLESSRFIDEFVTLACAAIIDLAGVNASSASEGVHLGVAPSHPHSNVTPANLSPPETFRIGTFVYPPRRINRIQFFSRPRQLLNNVRSN